MRSDAWLPLIATVISLEFTMALWRRWRQSRRSYLRSWLISFAFYTAGTAALWYGAAFGWDSPTFRVFYVCGAFLTTLWLAQGELELLIKPKVARIIGFFLVLTSAIVGFFIVAVPFVGDQVVSGSAMPHGKDLFPVPIRVAIVLGNILGTVVVVGGTLWSGWQSRGRGAAAASRFRGTLLIAAGVSFAAAGGAVTYFGEEAGFALSLTVGIALMYFGFVVASRRPGAHRAAKRRRRDSERGTTVEPGHLLDRDVEVDGDPAGEPPLPAAAQPPAYAGLG
jgi:hypothetical protein